jgi:hypothetical protein
MRNLPPGWAKTELAGRSLAQELSRPLVDDVVFTVPKLLRPYFLHRREFLGELCRCAWNTRIRFSSRR